MKYLLTPRNNNISESPSCENNAEKIKPFVQSLYEVSISASYFSWQHTFFPAFYLLTFNTFTFTSH